MNNEKDRKSFIFYESWLNVIPLMSEQEELEYYRAIMHYATTGELPESTTIGVKMAMVFVQAAMDHNEVKRERIIEKRREAGLKGANQRWQNMANDGKNGKCHQSMANDSNQWQTIANDGKCHQSMANDSNQWQTIANDGKNSYNVNGNVNEDVNVNVNGNVNEDVNVNVEDKSSLEREKINKKEILSLWNSVFENDDAVAKIRTIEGRRAMNVEAVIRQYGIEQIRQCLEKVSRSSHLHGNNKDGYAATFDWVFTTDAFARILEGQYDNKARKAKRTAASEPQYDEVDSTPRKSGKASLGEYLAELQAAMDGDGSMREKYKNWEELCAQRGIKRSPRP